MIESHIKNIVFDLGNVIVDLDYEAVYPALGVSTDKFEVLYNTELFRNFEIGKVSEEEFFRFLSENTAFKLSQIIELKKNLHKTFPLRKTMWELIYQLRGNYRLFLLSNTNVLDFPSVEGQFPIRDPFEKVYLSYEQGYRKPDVDIYLHAQKIFGINAEETLFLDDKSENIHGAESIGWRCIQVSSEEQSIHSLKAITGI